RRKQAGALPTRVARHGGSAGVSRPCRSRGGSLDYLSKGEKAMQYMLMCCIEEAHWERLPEGRKSEIMDEYGKFMQGIVKSGHFRATGRLQPTSTSTTVREKNGKIVTTDGPFAETKEQLGGYHLVECKDLDEALSIARRIPTLRVGGAIEVRPLMSASNGWTSASSTRAST